MATQFPAKPELTGVPLSKGAFRAGLDKLLDALAGVLGTDGTVATARATLGVASTTEIQAQAGSYAVAGGTANAIDLTLTPPVTALAAGMGLTFKASAKNTVSPTLDVDGLGAQAIKKLGGTTALEAGDIQAGQIVRVEYDGAAWQMQSQVGQGIASQQLAFVGEVRSLYGGVTAVPTGWDLLDGTTIGSPASLATKRDAGYEALFKHLWVEDATLVVDGGRGVSAQADWDADKDITLPDARGRSILGIGTGDTAEGGGAGTTRAVGDRGGAEDHTLTVAQMPAHTHDYGNESPLAGGAGSSDTFNDFPDNIEATSSTGGDQAHNNMTPFIAMALIIHSGVGL